MDAAGRMVQGMAGKLRATLARADALPAMLALLATLLLPASAAHAAATTYIFDGRAIAGCTISSATYACASLPLSDYQDKVEIASGYQVNLTQDAIFGYSQGLKMSGTARLTSYRDIDISGIQPSLLQVTGGSFLSDRAFRMGAQAQNITASIKADDIYLGTGSSGSVTGTIDALRSVTIASNMTVTGNISGSAITTSSPAKIVGSVTATTSFSLASGSTVTGNISAPTMSMLSAGSTVTGNVTISGNLTMGSTDTVTGNVSADTLTLQDSNAYIGGNATVRAATLGYGGRVAQKIYCTGGNTSASTCDCVTNNSGAGTPAPSCPAMAYTAPHHFKIVHPLSGPTCTPTTVTVTACANPACSSNWTGGASVTLSPGGGTFAIGASGVNNAATVSQASVGTTAITLPAGTPPLSCVTSAGAATDCGVAFSASALLMNIADHVADTTRTFTISAVKSASNAATCAPAFSGARTVGLSCNYTNPSTGSQTLRVANAANVTSFDASNSVTLTCDGSVQNLPMTFSSAGVADSTLKYPDVGSITLNASVASPALTGTDTFIVAPASFGFSAITGPPLTAGLPFKVTFSALNNSKTATPNFGKEQPAESIVLSFKKCEPIVPGVADVSALTPASVSSFTSGVATDVAVTWSEVGVIDLNAALASNGYLGSNLTASGNTNSAGACASNVGKVGRFKPDHFDVTLAQPQPGFTYSGQPITVTKVDAKNSAGLTTANYTGLFAKLVTLSAYDFAGTALNPGPGTLNAAVTATTPVTAPTIAASSFVAGVSSGSAVYMFTSALTAPLQVRLRATDSDSVTGISPDTNTASIRRGRLRLSGAFGRTNADLAVAFRTEYWTGVQWELNTLDNTPIPASAVKVTPTSIASVFSVTAQGLGRGTIVLTPVTNAIGPVDVVVNLGLTTLDNACITTHPASSAGNMPWLRALNGSCSTKYDRDPYTRATFGLIAPEQKRLIHMREVFR